MNEEQLVEIIRLLGGNDEAFINLVSFLDDETLIDWYNSVKEAYF